MNGEVRVRRGEPRRFNKLGTGIAHATASLQHGRQIHAQERIVRNAFSQDFEHLARRIELMFLKQLPGTTAKRKLSGVWMSIHFRSIPP
jgi:hypothetical protein